MPAKKGFNWLLWTKMLGTGAVVCIGGPALTWYVMPTDEQLFEKYNPDLQRKSLEGRPEREKGFDDFVTNLKRYSKSDKPIWVVQAEEEKRQRQEKWRESVKAAEAAKLRKQEMRREVGLPTDSLGK